MMQGNHAAVFSLTTIYQMKSMDYSKSYCYCNVRTEMMWGKYNSRISIKFMNERNMTNDAFLSTYQLKFAKLIIKRSIHNL